MTVAADTKRLNKLIRRAGSVVGEELASLEAVDERKALSVMDNSDHSLHRELSAADSPA